MGEEEVILVWRTEQERCQEIGDAHFSSFLEFFLLVQSTNTEKASGLK